MITKTRGDRAVAANSPLPLLLRLLLLCTIYAHIGLCVSPETSDGVLHGQFLYKSSTSIQIVSRDHCKTVN